MATKDVPPETTEEEEAPAPEPEPEMPTHANVEIPGVPGVHLSKVVASVWFPDKPRVSYCISVRIMWLVSSWGCVHSRNTPLHQLPPYSRVWSGHRESQRQSQSGWQWVKLLWMQTVRLMRRGWCSICAASSPNVDLSAGHSRLKPFTSEPIRQGVLDAAGHVTIVS